MADIKDISKAERSHQLLCELSKSTEDSVYFTDTEGRFEWVSETKAKNWGKTIKEMIGKTDFDFMSPEEAEVAWADSRRVMETGVPIKNKVQKLTRSDGSIVHYSVSKYPRYNEDDTIKGTVGISRDVSFIVKFLRTANHDIRNPIAAIGATLKLLFRGVYGSIDESVEKTLMDLWERTVKLEKFVEGYISDSMLENYEVPEKESLDLRADIVDFVLNEFIDEIEKNNIHFDNRLRSIPGGDVIISNRQYLTIIFRNIFQNFLRFTPQGGTIALGYEKTEAFLNIIYWNSGPPVPDDKWELIFVEGESTDSTGIGLPMCRELARKLGGDIWYENRDEHPTFVLSIPL